MNRLILFLLILICSIGCAEQESKNPEPSSEPEITTNQSIELNLTEANRLSELAKNCIQNPLPYKSGHVIDKPEDLAMPQTHHPAFYGCFDWHSAVHGHWSLVYLLKEFPELKDKDSIRSIIDRNLTHENIQTEIRYFTMNPYTKSFERTYGWAWLLKLAEELHSWEDPQAKKWLKNLLPLCEHIADQYISYLPKLVYPIRVGEHTNTAFGLSFAYDYALSTGDNELGESIRNNALRFYQDDKGCPINWEPSGHDFLSPCLQELDIMRKVLDANAFDVWLDNFMPGIKNGSLVLIPGEIIDRTDGKLVHLDGLNFSRAWCLYPVSGMNEAILNIADTHMSHSLGKITDGHYMGEHWLASFALYAYKSKTLSNL